MVVAGLAGRLLWPRYTCSCSVWQREPREQREQRLSERLGLLEAGCIDGGCAGSSCAAPAVAGATHAGGANSAVGAVGSPVARPFASLTRQERVEAMARSGLLLTCPHGTKGAGAGGIGTGSGSGLPLLPISEAPAALAHHLGSLRRRPRTATSKAPGVLAATKLVEAHFPNSRNCSGSFGSGSCVRRCGDHEWGLPTDSMRLPTGELLVSCAVLMLVYHRLAAAQKPTHTVQSHESCWLCMKRLPPWCACTAGACSAGPACRSSMQTQPSSPPHPMPFHPQSWTPVSDGRAAHADGDRGRVL